MTEYALSDIANLPAGTIHVTLFSEFVGLTVPTYNTVISIDALNDKADVEPGIQEMRTLTVVVGDDTTIETEGFWYRVLGGDCYLQFDLVEAAVSTHYFFGTPDKLQVEWETLYDDSSTFIRKASFEILSMEDILFDGLTSNFVTEVKAQKSDTYRPADGVVGYCYTFIKIKDLFACMLSSSGLNPSYSAADVEVVFDATRPHLAYQAPNYLPAEYHAIDEICMVVEYVSVVSPLTASYTRYLNTQWETDFHTLRTFIPALLKTFQILLRFDYDVANNRHLIKLYQREFAHPNSEAMSFDHVPTSRTLRRNTDLRIDAARAYITIDTTRYNAWTSKANYTTIQIGDIPDYISLDIDILTLFAVQSADPANSAEEQSPLLYIFDTTAENPPHWSATPGDSDNVKYVEYYDHATQAYVPLTSGVYYLLQSAIVGYLIGAFAGEFRIIEDVYRDFSGSNGTTDSHTLLLPFMRRQINDGTDSAWYYANEVEKRVAQHEFMVIWHEELS